MNVELLPFDELSPEQQEAYKGEENATFLIVSHHGKVFRTESDAIESGYARFSRDLYWVAEALEEAYALGHAANYYCTREETTPMKVELCDFSELSPEQQEEHAYGEEDTFLIVSHEGKVIRMESDGMEPEDARFYRSLSWIAEAIEEAYELGLTSGRGL